MNFNHFKRRCISICKFEKSQTWVNIGVTSYEWWTLSNQLFQQVGVAIHFSSFLFFSDGYRPRNEQSNFFSPFITENKRRRSIIFLHRMKRKRWKWHQYCPFFRHFRRSDYVRGKGNFLFIISCPFIELYGILGHVACGQALIPISKNFFPQIMENSRFRQIHQLRMWAYNENRNYPIPKIRRRFKFKFLTISWPREWLSHLLRP